MSIDRAPGTMPRRRRQHGVSLIIVMLLLVIVSILGAGAAQIALLGERSTRNDRDAQVAWQAAEAALTDAVVDLRGSVSPNRADLFGVNAAAEVNVNSFVTGCSTADRTQGLCATQSDGTAKPIWLTVDFMNFTASSPTVPIGKFTNRQFKTGTPESDITGVQPSRPPRYMVELVRDTGASRDAAESNPPWAFRVTAMGFGPREDIQAVLQMVYRN